MLYISKFMAQKAIKYNNKAVYVDLGIAPEANARFWACGPLTMRVRILAFDYEQIS